MRKGTNWVGENGEGRNTFQIVLYSLEVPSSASSPSIGSVFVSFGSVQKVLKVEMGQNTIKVGWSGQSGVPEEIWEGQGWVEGCLLTLRWPSLPSPLLPLASTVTHSPYHDHNLLSPRSLSLSSLTLSRHARYQQKVSTHE